jgi:uncharacterized protein
MNTKFIETVQTGYSVKGESIYLGAAMHNGATIAQAKVAIPLATLNRHGLVAGATGTGKTKTLQKLVESFSLHGIPSLVMDVKGDFSGISRPGELNEKVQARIKELEVTWSAKACPVEFLSITDENGVKMRATISEFGPILLSKILELNETQTSVLSMIFKYCDDNGLLLLDTKDLKKALNYVINEGKEALKEEYGAVSPATVGTILRNVVQLEEQGAELFFGEPSFDTNDLLKLDENGKGMVNIMRVSHLQQHPNYFSTFMLSLLSEIYHTYPEEGDMDKPKLMLLIDEAHLIFNNASSTLVQELETMIKLIRSKGVGILFCTQLPTDIPTNILSQLGLKVQHALRAFTANDRKAIKLVSENYPETEFYDTATLLTELGIGEAFVTALSEKGVPTPLVHTKIAPPESRMDTITEDEMNSIIMSSRLTSKYNTAVNRESAYEKLSAKVQTAVGSKTSSGQDSSQVLGGVLAGAGGLMASPVGKMVMQQAKLVAGQLVRSGIRSLLGSIMGGAGSKRK